MSVSTLLTEEEFLNLPEFVGKQELLDGELIELPPAKHSHGKVAKRITHLLEATSHASRVWIESAYRLRSGRWLIPDVSVSWPEQRIENDWFQGAPMLAVEIASRGNTAEEIDRKVTAYLEDGAAEVWVIYPRTLAMTVARPDSTLRVAATADYRCDLLGVTVTPDDRDSSK